MVKSFFVHYLCAVGRTYLYGIWTEHKMRGDDIGKRTDFGTLGERIVSQLTILSRTDISKPRLQGRTTKSYRFSGGHCHDQG